jgi:hypothetical protein
MRAHHHARMYLALLSAEFWSALLDLLCPLIELMQRITPCGGKAHATLL